MFNICDFIEQKNKLIIRKLKVLFWKIKYGSRLKIGKNLLFRKRFNILIGENAYLEIGDNCFFNNDCSINCLEGIKIGNDNLFGESVKIYDHNHIFSFEKLERNTFKKKVINIGNNNWFGSNVIILSKAVIGNNNVIGAGNILNLKIDNNKLVTQNYSNLVIKDIEK